MQQMSRKTLTLAAHKLTQEVAPQLFSAAASPMQFMRLCSMPCGALGSRHNIERINEKQITSCENDSSLLQASGTRRPQKECQHRGKGSGCHAEIGDLPHWAIFQEITAARETEGQESSQCTLFSKLA